MKPRLRPYFLALCLFALVASPAVASAAAPPGAVFGNYFHDFVAYWKDKARDQNTIVFAALGVGAVAILIIVTSKKGK
jgi:hypothetical protein